MNMIIGVTGRYAAGKSTVARKVASLTHARLLDADKIAHYILDRNASVRQQLRAFFGKEILNKKGKIDRKALAKIVFSNREKLKILCNIVHPEVIAEIKESTKNILKNNKSAYVVIDAPLLIEAGLVDFCDLIIVVTASIPNAIKRAVKHSGLDKDGALKRIRAQMPILEKKKYADYVIRNDGSMKELEAKVKKLMKEIG